jgi:hypothetical protein
MAGGRTGGRTLTSASVKRADGSNGGEQESERNKLEKIIRGLGC